LGVLQESLVVNGSDLTIEGDQFGPNYDDNIVIDKTAAGGLQITINGNTVEYAPDQIKNLTINTGGGTNTVTLLTPFSFTLNGGGTDKLILGPSLPTATYTPDPSGPSDWGILNIETILVDRRGTELQTGLCDGYAALASSCRTGRRQSAIQSRTPVRHRPRHFTGLCGRDELVSKGRRTKPLSRSSHQADRLTVVPDSASRAGTLAAVPWPL
jgi:hypothetical protein